DEGAGADNSSVGDGVSDACEGESGAGTGEVSGDVGGVSKCSSVSGNSEFDVGTEKEETVVIPLNLLVNIGIYRYEVLIENLMDPSHVPYAHYGIMNVSRYEVLIENLMDPSHAPYAHYGIMNVPTDKSR
ncbi:hypothetical protein IFM89_038273, partial [Coptis chinensis]